MGKNILNKLIRNRSAMIGLTVIVVLLFAGIFADKLTTHNPELTDITNKFLPASREYPLGTDQMGRCMLCRLIFGIRVSMFSAIKVTFIIVLIGVFLGLMAGYCGGVVDNLIMRLADIASTFPSTLLALAIVGIFEPGLDNLVLVFICLWWAPFARMVRSSVIKFEGDGIRFSGRSQRLQPVGNRSKAHPAKHALFHHCICHTAHCSGDYAYCQLFVYWLGFSATNAGLGRNAQRWPSVHRYSSGDASLAGTRNCDCGVCI